MSNTAKKFKVQLITDGEARWPYVGNAYENKDGSLNVYLDEGVKLAGGQKLRVRPAKPKAGAAAE